MLLATVLTGAGCADRTAPVTVVLAGGLPDVPGGREIVALPFDPVRILDSLTAAAPEPPPAFPELEAELRGFAPPPRQDPGETGLAWQATRDSVLRLSDSLRQADRRSSGYGAAYARFRRLYRRLAELGALREARARSLTAEARNLALQAGRAADSLRRWEAAAHADFDSLATRAARASGREPVRAVPDHEGRARLDLAPGTWWIMWRLPHPENPFLESVWRVRVVSARGFGFQVPLLPETAEVRWRH